MILGAIASPWWWLIGAILGFTGLFYIPYKRLFFWWEDLSTFDKVQALIWVPTIRVTGDIAKMVGYPIGWKWRLERLSTQPELRWQQHKNPQ